MELLEQDIGSFVTAPVAAPATQADELAARTSMRGQIAKLEDGRTFAAVATERKRRATA